MKDLGNVDSKFRFVIIAAKRARQILKGSKPKVKSKSRNPIRIAQDEVRAGVVEYEILPVAQEEIIERDETLSVDAVAGADEPDEVVEEEEEAAETVPETDEDDDEDEEEEGLPDILKEDKDD